MKIKRVAIVGGTHGNELIGIELVKKFQRSPHLIQRSNFESCTLLANPKACQMIRRYVDEDLNRCFHQRDLADFNLSSYEAQRAKLINHMIGKNGQNPADLIIDLHTTTSNMGLTLILASKHPVNLQLAAHLVVHNPAVKVLSAAVDHPDAPYLDSISDFGFTIEVGAVAQGVLDAVLFQQTEALINSVLDYVEAYNQEELPPLKESLTLYQRTQTIEYPKDADGNIQAMIHPKLQFRDYQPLRFGDPMFLTFDHQEITYDGNEVIYPVFINEAAYYEKGVAMHVTQKVQERLTYSFN